MSTAWVPLGLEHEWLIACASSALKAKPLALTLLGRPLVLFRTAEGLAALEDRCPHRHAPLSLGRGGARGITCLYHGWSFDRQGRCRHVPGSERVPLVSVPCYAVRERDGWIWVALSAARQPEPPERLPEVNRFDRLQWVTQVEASLVDALENLLDATHTPFVHRGLVRSEGPRRSMTVQVSRRGGLVEARYLGVEANPGWLSRLFEQGRQESLGRFQRPNLAQLEYRDAKGVSFQLHAHFSPIEVRRQAVFVDLFTRKGWLPPALKHLLLTPLLRRVMRQDQAILAAKTANAARFAERPIVSTELDLMRPHLEALLAGKDEEAFEGSLQLLL